MARRQTAEARVLAYFTDAELPAAELMFGLVRDIIRRRTARPTGEPRKGKSKRVDKKMTEADAVNTVV